MEEELVSKMEKFAKEQKKFIKQQSKLADQITDTTIAREMMTRTMRDVLKQMQTLARESKSNIKEKEVKIFENLIHENDTYVEANKIYLNAIKDLAVRKEYFIETLEQLASALDNVADKRADVIKKALSVEKAKNKMIEGAKLTQLDQELNDFQRDFERARDVFLKNIEQYLQSQEEINQLWQKLKQTITNLS
ncbi:MAG: hypothetical protein P8Y70_07440 [Candidatus Lokiarchaeota archaeon]